MRRRQLINGSLSITLREVEDARDNAKCAIVAHALNSSGALNIIKIFCIISARVACKCIVAAIEVPGALCARPYI